MRKTTFPSRNLLRARAPKVKGQKPAPKLLKIDNVLVPSSLQIGHAGEHICGGAEHFDADLIVTSTHERTGFKHALVGSTAEYVVRHADCSVLVVPGRGRPILTSTPKNL
jgi:nucleotide-binding universal stress UspA family protein